MLFKRQTLEGIVAGTVDLAFRRWRRPTVRPGTMQRTVVGVVAIESVEPVVLEAVTDDDARRAGYGSLDELRAWLNGRQEGDIYRIGLRLAGADPRIALRENADLDAAELAEIHRRLTRLDSASRHGPWTFDVLRLIASRPGERAIDLAATLGREKLPFKADVRKLKELGLTESLPTGYRLSPRGRVVLARLDDESRTE